MIRRRRGRLTPEAREAERWLRRAIPAGELRRNIGRLRGSELIALAETVADLHAAYAARAGVQSPFAERAGEGRAPVFRRHGVLLAEEKFDRAPAAALSALLGIAPAAIDAARGHLVGR